MEIWIIERILKNFERLSWEIYHSLFLKIILAITYRVCLIWKFLKKSETPNFSRNFQIEIYLNNNKPRFLRTCELKCAKREQA